MPLETLQAWPCSVQCAALTGQAHALHPPTAPGALCMRVQARLHSRALRPGAPRSTFP